MTNNKIEIFRGIALDCVDIYESKNHDYGDSFARTRAAIPNAILVRLHDKLNRLTTLMAGEEAQVADEKIEDTLLDMANYCLMELTERVCDGQTKVAGGICQEGNESPRKREYDYILYCLHTAIDAYEQQQMHRYTEFCGMARGAVDALIDVMEPFANAVLHDFLLKFTDVSRPGIYRVGDMRGRLSVLERMSELFVEVANENHGG